MKKHTSLFLLGVLVFASGCATTRRSVTHVRVEKDKAFIAYAEWDEGFMVGSNDRSRVKRCSINADNSLTCAEDADINHVLNPQEDPAPAPAEKKPAPAEEAPAEGAAPAEAPAEAPATPAAS